MSLLNTFFWLLCGFFASFSFIRRKIRQRWMILGYGYIDFIIIFDSNNFVFRTLPLVSVVGIFINYLQLCKEFIMDESVDKFIYTFFFFYRWTYHAKLFIVYEAQIIITNNFILQELPRICMTLALFESLFCQQWFRRVIWFNWVVLWKYKAFTYKWNEFSLKYLICKLTFLLRNVKWRK